MGDVLRVLYLFSRSLWLPEIASELEGFVRTLGERAYSLREVEEAVRKLEELGLVKTKRGIRASIAEREEETILVTLSSEESLISMLASDEKVRRYRQILFDALSSLRRNLR